MANRAWTCKRVYAIRRAPDGSAFEKCKSCGVSVAIALADMHECEAGTSNAMKRFRGLSGKQRVVDNSSAGQPRSPFRFFMEDFAKTCKTGNRINIDRIGFENWKNMSKEERQPYVIQAEKVNSTYTKALIEEIDFTSEGRLKYVFFRKFHSSVDCLLVDDEADSAMVGKFDPLYGDCGFHDNYSSFHGFRPKRIESFNTWEWEMVKSWIVESSQ